jgi:hypothetical protein
MFLIGIHDKKAHLVESQNYNQTDQEGEERKKESAINYLSINQILRLTQESVEYSSIRTRECIRA